MNTPSASRLTWDAMLMLAVITLVVCAPSAGAAQKGLQTDLSWGISAEDQRRTLDALAPTGVQWLRLDISWRTVEESRGVYNYANLAITDVALEQALGLGTKVIIAVNESPGWASGSTNHNAPPADPADYARFMTFVAERYKGRVAAYEIWNEPNHPRFWPTGPDPAAYARLLRAAGPAVRAGDPDAKVIFGGLAHNDYRYLEAVYAADPAIGDTFDVMATHPYTAGGASPDTVTLSLNGRASQYDFLAYREIRATMANHDDPKPIWLTEFGWSTNSAVSFLAGVSETLQAAYLTRAYELLEADPYVEVAFVYNLRNNWWANDANTWEDQLGLLRTDFTPKLAYHAYSAYTPPTPPAPAPDPVTETPDEVARPAPEEPPASATAEAAPAAPAAAALAPLPSLAKVETPAAERAVTRMRVSARALGAATTARPSRARAGLRIRGRVTGASSGRVRIVLERRRGRRWVAQRAVRATLRHGSFARDVSVARGGRWRVRSQFEGSARHLPARAPTVHILL